MGKSIRFKFYPHDLGPQKDQNARRPRNTSQAYLEPSLCVFVEDLGGAGLAHSKAHLSPLVLRLPTTLAFNQAARFAKSNSPRRSGKIRALSPS